MRGEFALMRQSASRPQQFLLDSNYTGPVSGGSTFVSVVALSISALGTARTCFKKSSKALNSFGFLTFHLAFLQYPTHQVE